MKFKLLFLILVLLLTGCAESDLPDSADIADSQESPAPHENVTPSPEPSPTPEPSASEEITASPSPTFFIEDRFERFDSAMHDVFPEAVRIPEMIHARYGVNGEITADFNGDGTDDVFYYTSEYLNTGDEYDNYPTRLKLTIGETQLVYDSAWNDGLLLFTADFDESDSYVDIGIVDTGTDVQCGLRIFHYDGNEITEYDRIEYLFTDPLYTDGNGSIFYFSDGYVDLGNGDFDIDYDRYEQPERYDYKIRAISPNV